MKILNLGPEVYKLLTNNSNVAVLSKNNRLPFMHTVEFQYKDKKTGKFLPYTKPTLARFDSDTWVVMLSSQGVAYLTDHGDVPKLWNDMTSGSNILYMGMIDNKKLQLCSDVTIFVKPEDISQVKIFACGDIFTKTSYNDTINKFGRHYAHAFAYIPKTAWFANADKMYSGTSGLEIKKYDVTKRMALTFQDILFKEGIRC